MSAGRGILISSNFATLDHFFDKKFKWWRFQPNIYLLAKIDGETRRDGSHLGDDLHALGDGSSQICGEISIGGEQSPDFAVDVGAKSNDPLVFARRLVGGRLDGWPGFVSTLESSGVGFRDDGRLDLGPRLGERLALVDESRVVRRRRVVRLSGQNLDPGCLLLDAIDRLKFMIQGEEDHRGKVRVV